MGMSDKETVALIGGGHAFGKFHGACTTGPGPDPSDSPADPWPGTCGDSNDLLYGKGPNTFTSGLEGQWTLRPTVWDNEYFTDLLAYDWDVETGPGGKHQWFPVSKDDSEDGELPDITMLTTDIALLMVNGGDSSRVGGDDGDRSIVLQISSRARATPRKEMCIAYPNRFSW